ncbi:hypothetical protein MMC22_004695 [Lobaria immixta]|nr:hypothetical protein [Lobaria immixta]
METGPDPGTLAGDGLPEQPTAAAPAPVVNAPVIMAEKELALLEQSIADLEAEKLQGFAPKGLQTASELIDKDTLALESREGN